MEMVWCFFRKLEQRITILSKAIPLWGAYTPKLIEGIQTDTCMPVFIAALLAIEAKGHKMTLDVHQPMNG